MQPPTYTPAAPPLRSHSERLRAAAKSTAREPLPRHLHTLHAQLAEWLSAMSPEQRGRRFTMEEVERLSDLSGKHGGRAAHHHIAQVLRRLGFTPGRDWSMAGRNRRFWKLERTQ